MSTNLDEIWQESLVTWMWVQFDPDRSMDVSRPNRFFVACLKCIITPVIYAHTTDLRAVCGKPINVWVANSAVVKHYGSF